MVSNFMKSTEENSTFLYTLFNEENKFTMNFEKIMKMTFEVNKFLFMLSEH